MSPCKDFARATGLILALACAIGCANAKGGDGAAIDASGIPDAPSTRADAPLGSADARDDVQIFDARPPDARVFTASQCPADQFAVGFDGSEALVCATIDAAAKAAFQTDCQLHVGWRDSCDGCTTTPTKWGRVGGTECVLGTGADNTCSTATLGGVSVRLLGMNTDGDVNDDDKFYLGWHCTTPTDTPVAGPCPAGSYISGVSEMGFECVTAREVITEYLRTSCELYYGWRDSCDGCVTAPAKWGRVSTTACTNGLGVDNTCNTYTLGGQSVRMLGLNTDGDVNDDDKHYLGFRCSGATPATSTAEEICPAGQLVVGRESNGDVQCASPVPAAEALVQSGCYLYQGFRDNCGGCTTAPAKWSRTSQDSCEPGTGANNTCSMPSLGGTAVNLSGLNTDGDVDDNDKYYFGVVCP